MAATIMSRILSYFRSILDVFLNRGKGGIVPPVRIRTEVEKAARGLVVRWEDGVVSFPNAYELRFDGSSWDHYYGKRVKETQRHVKKMVEDMVRGSGGHVESEIVVSLFADESLPSRSITADAFFTIPTVKNAQQASASENPPATILKSASSLKRKPGTNLARATGTTLNSLPSCESTGKPSTNMENLGGTILKPSRTCEGTGSEENSLKTDSCSTVKMGKERPLDADSLTGTKLSKKNKVACLVSPLFENSISIKDGYTIGVPRYANVALPDIQLPASSDFSYVSHHHATFTMRADGTWFIESLGMNGTAVMRNGVEMSVERGKPYALDNGDVITLAGIENTAMTIFIGRDANAKLMKAV